ncbi:hypothetical protein ACFQX4_26830 [Roseomonas sp. GCM10028921]
MPLTLHPSPPSSVIADRGRAERVQIWDGLEADGRRLLLAQARAVAEVMGRHSGPRAEGGAP